MVHVQRTFLVSAPAAAVVDYLADFAHAEQWDPGTVSCDPIEPGPVRVGSTWRNVSKLLGNKTELTYELLHWESDRVVVQGDNKSATAVDDIRVVPHGAGQCQVTYDATVTMKGAAKVAAPLMQLLFFYLGVKTEKQMKDVLPRVVSA